MRLVRAFVLVALTAAVAAGASPSAHAAATTPPCIPKYGSSGGHSYVDYCGPATATLKVSGKTYNFTQGYCSTDSKAGIVFELTLGVIDQSKSPGNGGHPLFQLQDLKTGGLSLVTLNADYDGAALPLSGPSLKGSIPQSGTIVASKYATPTFSGSWNCHGTLITSP